MDYIGVDNISSLTFLSRITSKTNYKKSFDGMNEIPIMGYIGRIKNATILYSMTAYIL